MYYKENFDEVIDRNLKLANPDYCGALIHICEIEQMQDRVKMIPGRHLNQWDFDHELYDYLDIELQNTKLNWSNRTEILDDAIPTISPYFGIAEHSSFMGGEVNFEVDTSYQVPFIKTSEDIDGLRFHRDNKLLNHLLNGLEYFMEKGKDQVAVELRGSEDAGDVANAVRGNDLFMDFYDEPDDVHKLFQKCYEGIVQYMKCQRAIVGDFCGGTVSGMSAIMPANSFGHLAMDWTYMCSASFFGEFGKELLMKQVEPYDAALMHIHSGGAHVIPELAKIDKISYVQLAHDPNQMTGIETFKKYAGDLKNKFIVCESNMDELKENLEFLSDKRILIRLKAKTFAEAQDIVRFVKDNLPIRRRKA